jgi:hypothetical protein
MKYHTPKKPSDIILDRKHMAGIDEKKRGQAMRAAQYKRLLDGLDDDSQLILISMDDDDSVVIVSPAMSPEKVIRTLRAMVEAAEDGQMDEFDEAMAVAEN